LQDCQSLLVCLGLGDVARGKAYEIPPCALFFIGKSLVLTGVVFVRIGRFGMTDVNRRGHFIIQFPNSCSSSRNSDRFSMVNSRSWLSNPFKNGAMP